MTTDCIVSEIQLKYQPQPLTETIYGAKDIHQLLISRVFDADTIGYKETFKVLLLNNAADDLRACGLLISLAHLIACRR